jgi:arylsulfatase
VGDWKLLRTNLSLGKRAIAQGRKPTTELFNLAADPREEHDVAAQHPEVVARLMQMMKTQHTPSNEFPFAALDQ